MGVVLGAFGAHALKPILDALGRTDTFELAVRYQFYHAFALLLAGVLQQFIQTPTLRFSSLFFLMGTLLFSGSLYTLSFSGLTVFGMVTPVGGVMLITGWAFLLYGILKGTK
jgi:uncharacterized membrane protein YgdD (TMEM256/DUF423 family)